MRVFYNAWATLRNARNTRAGFTLPEVLLVMAIIGLLGAIVVPLMLGQQDRAAVTTIKADLTNVATALQTELMNSGGVPPEQTAGNGPSPLTVETDVLDTSWQAVFTIGSGTLTPPITGPTSDGIEITGQVAVDGTFCLDGKSVDHEGAGNWRFLSTSTQPDEGTCAAAVTAGLFDPGAEASTQAVASGSVGPGDLPGIPAALDVETNQTAKTATVSWTAVQGQTYAVRISGYSVKTFTATVNGEATCLFPADTCDATEPNGTLKAGLYTASVRAGNTNGWGPGANKDFTIDSTGTGGGSGSGIPAGQIVNMAAPHPSPIAAVGTALGRVRVSWVIPSTAGSQSVTYTVVSNPDQHTCMAIDTTACYVTGLDNDRSYSFTVRATTIAGTGTPGTTNTVTTPADRKATEPTGLIAQAGNAQVTLSWSAPADQGGSPVSDYLIEYKAASDAYWTSFSDGKSTSLTTIVNGLKNGTDYDFRVSAVNAAGPGPGSLSVQTRPMGPPTKPQNVIPVRQSTQVPLSWTAPANTGGGAILDYIVQYKTTESTMWLTFDEPEQNVTNTIVTGLSNGTTYEFRIAGKNLLWTGAWSDVVTMKPFTIPSAPMNVIPTRADSKTPLTWTAPFDGGDPITDYKVEYRKTADTTWSVFPHTPSPDTAITVTGLQNGTEYQFRVSGVNPAGTGEPSANAVMLPYTVPDAPTSLTMDLTSKKATLWWTTPEWNGGNPLTGYRVEQSNDGTTWTTSNTSKIFPTPVTTDLIAAFDATNTASWPGSGTVWRDTSGNNNHIQLGATPTVGSNGYFASLGGGTPTIASSATFNQGTFANEQTIQMCIAAPSNPTGATFVENLDLEGTGSIIQNGSTLTYSYGDPAHAGQTTGLTGIGTGRLTGTTPTTTATNPVTVSNDEITCYTVVRNLGDVRWYTNGHYTNSTNNPFGALTAGSLSNFVNIASITKSATGQGSPWSGQIASLAFYNRSLTEKEITQNWNAVKQTFRPNLVEVRDLTNASHIKFRVRALNTAGAGEPSNMVAGTPDATVPNEPAITTAAKESTVTLSWDAPDNGDSPISDYVISYRKAGTVAWTTYEDGETTSTTTDVGGLTNGTLYDFRVAAVNSVGMSIPSAVRQARPLNTVTGGDIEYILNVGGQFHRVHVFLKSQALTANTSFTGDVFLVGGGGGGGNYLGGGGGGGGVVYKTNVTIPAATYYVNVGNGGAGGTAVGNDGRATTRYNGGDTFISTLTTTIPTAKGGGYGGNDTTAGNTGGSGGGGGSANGAAGARTDEQGNPGGAGTGTTGNYNGGGGGGAGGPGTAGSMSTTAGNGGPGLGNNITGDIVHYAGGGGGSSARSSNGRAGNGGTGGGGGGGVGTNPITATPGTGGTEGWTVGNAGRTWNSATGITGGHGAGGAGGTNTGGGGGGSEYEAGGAGGTGIAIVRYPIPGKPAYATAPRNVTGTPGDLTATITWDAPTNAGGTPITGYRVEYKPETQPLWIIASDTIAPTARSYEFHNVYNNINYQFRVSAINDAGAGAVSNPVTVKPVGGASGGDESMVTVGNTVYRVHMFRNPGTTQFTVNNTDITGRYLVVGGGGGGGSDMGGGGGGGGVVEGDQLFPVGTYNMTVGTGGQGAPAGYGQRAGYNGQPSSISSTTGATTKANATGGTVTTLTRGGDTYQIHTYTTTGAGTFNVPTNGPTKIDYLVVGGGGGGGADMGGGGGGGGVLQGATTVTPGTTYNVYVGAGGAGAPATNLQRPGRNGEDSYITGGNPTTVSPLITNSGGVGVIQVAAGSYHSCALLTTTEVMCWGNDNWGQLGDGTATGTSTSTPTYVLTSGTDQSKNHLNRVKSISVGNRHTCATLIDGRAMCWGQNGDGKLGDGTNGNRVNPVYVLGSGTNQNANRLYGIDSVAAGGAHTCAVMKRRLDDVGGSVMCWGTNSSQQLGDNSTAERWNPVYSVFANGQRLSAITEVDPGEGGSTCARTAAGHVLCWGQPSNGQLGNGYTSGGYMTPTYVTVSGTSQDPSNRLSNVSQIASQGLSTCALITDGSVKCWGYNGLGNIGNGTTTNPQPNPVNVLNSGTDTSPSNWVTGVEALASYMYGTCAITTTGQVRCWGDGAYGTTGNGTGNNALNPVTVETSTGGPLTNVHSMTGSPGSLSMCAVQTRTDGTRGIACWGDNSNAQLGLAGGSATRATPTAITAGNAPSRYTVTQGGDTYTIDVFTNADQLGSFTVPASGPNEIEYLVVGGGGGGGMDMGGGGGGGGVTSGKMNVQAGKTYTVEVGAGGSGAPAAQSSRQPNSHQYLIGARNGGNSFIADTTASTAVTPATGGKISKVMVGSTEYTVHMFTDTSRVQDFAVPASGGPTSVEYLAVGGGGGGGTNMGGGGGAGGVSASTFNLAAGTTYKVKVGAGGQGAPGTGQKSGLSTQWSVSGIYRANTPATPGNSSWIAAGLTNDVTPATGGTRFQIGTVPNHTTANYMVHAFTTTGTSTFSVPAGGPTTVEYLIVGGGGGGSGNVGGGGGAGGVLQGTTTVTPGNDYNIVVGNGGNGGGAAAAYGDQGQNSSAFGLTAIGGGRGAGWGAGVGGTGGSGGGSSWNGGTTAGGAGTTGQGYAAGTITSWFYPTGGGGAGGSSGTNSGLGGPGIASDILGPRYFFGGGGGASGYSTTGGNGGIGGGGGGAINTTEPGMYGINAGQPGGGGGINSTPNTRGGNGGANTGGGGGGGSSSNGAAGGGGNGGSGIVIVRYLYQTPAGSPALGIGGGAGGSGQAGSIQGYAGRGAGTAGGSGGGATGYDMGGGAGAALQGNAGGNSGGNYYPAGGGGANGAGVSNGGNPYGGSGVPSDILGTRYYFGGGGGGAGYSNCGGEGGNGGGGGGAICNRRGGLAGLNLGENGGGGSGSNWAKFPGGNGGANTGGGGGGAGHGDTTALAPGGNGGSGIVIIRYPSFMPATTVEAAGGGAGGSSYANYTPGWVGANGANGGGMSAYSNGSSRVGGQGLNGGYDGGNAAGQYYGGGGGGANGPGSTNYPNGGGGVYNGILRGANLPQATGDNTTWSGTTGVNMTYFGNGNLYWGGGGGGSGYSNCGGNGGIGGGGGGAICDMGGGGTALMAGQTTWLQYNTGGGTNSAPQLPGGSGGVNTGGGGGGGSHYSNNNAGGDGGSGIVIVKYRTGTRATNIVALGGGGGASNHNTYYATAGTGASGGGASGGTTYAAANRRTGGTGSTVAGMWTNTAGINQGLVGGYGGALSGFGTPGQGYAGGNGRGQWYPGGGGGAGSVGGSNPAHGGSGAYSDINGTGGWFGGGGGGAGYSPCGGNGGIGGGGGGAVCTTYGGIGGFATNGSRGGGGGGGGQNAGPNTVGGTALVNTGGGGGGGSHSQGGGGAGASGIIVIRYKSVTTPINIVAIGGGGGASIHNHFISPAGNGASGGGASGGSGVPILRVDQHRDPNTGGMFGEGTPGQGFDGAQSIGQWYPGGGGGAGGIGMVNPGHGGPGKYTNILGAGLYFGGGGGASGHSPCGGNGGIGGGGGGAICTTYGGAGLNPGSNGGGGSQNAQANTPGGNGGVNTGGGGGGGAHYNSNNYGGNGGSGIVIVRYPVYTNTTTAPVAPSGGAMRTITVNGEKYITHTFTNTATFTSGSPLDIDYLAVGGGGGGGRGGAGGGGGGRMVEGTMTMPPGSTPITIGSGGTGSTTQEASGVAGTDGGNTTIGGLVFALGGGGGASRDGSAYGTTGRPGGSGGGGSHSNFDEVINSGGTTDANFGGYGNPGGNGASATQIPRSTQGWHAGGGGGGAGTPGVDADPSTLRAGNGGNGRISTISGTPTYYAAGGGAATYGDSTAGSGTPGFGGYGGGGNGASYHGNWNRYPTHGLNGTGSGGGGATWNYGNGGNGGNGIVVLRYKASDIPGLALVNGSAPGTGWNMNEGAWTNKVYAGVDGGATTLVTTAGSATLGNTQNIYALRDFDPNFTVHHYAQNTNGYWFQWIYGGTQTYTLTHPLMPGRWANIFVQGGGGTTGATLGNLQLRINNAWHTPQQAVTAGLIDPLVLVGSGISSTSYRFSNPQAFVTGGTTGAGNYPDISVMFKPLAQVESILFTSNVTFNQAYDGLYVRQYRDLQLSAMAPVNRPAFTPTATGGTVTTNTVSTPISAVNGNATTWTVTGRRTYGVTTFTATGVAASLTNPTDTARSADYLVVGGGGGGGMDMGGGGGAGGVLTGSMTLTPDTALTVRVGAGGAGAPAANTNGQPGGHQYTIPARNGLASSIRTATSGTPAQATGGTVSTLQVGADEFYAIHAYTTVGASTFTTPAAGVNKVEYLIVGGGGGGGSDIGGGGGAGGYLAGTVQMAPSTTYNVTVGAGGAGAVGYGNNPPAGTNGGYSAVRSTTGNTALATGGAMALYESGGTTYAVHTFSTFNATSTFTVPAGGPTTVDMVLVGGGGGGGWDVGGGGGAGGMVEANDYAVSAGSYTVTIGARGAGADGGNVAGKNGGNTNLSRADTNTNITAVGGGGGGSWSNTAGASGGSGGGQTSNYNGAAFASTQTSGVGYVGYGNPGGKGAVNTSNANNYAGASGGGGAGGPGGNGSGTAFGYNSSTYAYGGPGRQSSITGTARWYAAGGPGSDNGSGNVGAGQPGGAWTGYRLSPPTGTGSGGGGGGNNDVYGERGGTGSPGIMIIRYPVKRGLIDLIAPGGGGGGSGHTFYVPYAGAQGQPGGSGGGNSTLYGFNLADPGTGTPGMGNNGGLSMVWGADHNAGGGGGSGAVGNNGVRGAQAGNGGIGTPNGILGVTYYWAAGGGGASHTNTGGKGGEGGAGGGGVWSGYSAGAGGMTGYRNGSGGGAYGNGGAAGANTGSGGGGASHQYTGGAGGSGIVVLRYRLSSAPVDAVDVTALGGGAGGSSTWYYTPGGVGSAGASGGGASGYDSRAGSGGGAGIAGQGFNGGNAGGSHYSGGGGGAGGPGVSGPSYPEGGIGRYTDILGIGYYFGGGGGGAGHSTCGGPGGLGGGGGGAVCGPTPGGTWALNAGQNGGGGGGGGNTPGGDAGANTGGGGGGGSHYNSNNRGGNGGTGYIAVRYDAAPPMPLGSTPQTAANSAQEIKLATGTTQDGAYWINLPNVGPTLVWCIMDNYYAGGGWMMALRSAQNSTTFNYDASYWTQRNTYNQTNTLDTVVSGADAKFNTFNYFPARDVFAIFKDSYTGGIYPSQGAGWTWYQPNIHPYGWNTDLVSFFTGTNWATGRRRIGDPYATTMYNSNMFAVQSGFRWYGFNYWNNNSAAKVRWGFAGNNENDESSNDWSSGIGMQWNSWSAGTYGSPHRSYPMEMYVR